MIRKKLAERNEAYLQWLMTLVGGFLGTFAITQHAGIFASAQTGNVMEIAVELISLKTGMIGYRLLAVLIFATGIVLAYILTNYTKLNMRKLALWVDAFGLLASSLLPLESVFIGTYPIFFCSAFQWGVYSAADGFNSSSIFTTNNFKQCLIGLTQYVLTKDRVFRKKAVMYTNSVICFVLGCLLGVWSVNTFAASGAYVAFLPLLGARVIIGLCESVPENETPEEIEEEAAEEEEEAVLLEEDAQMEDHKEEETK